MKGHCKDRSSLSVSSLPPVSLLSPSLFSSPPVVSDLLDRIQVRSSSRGKDQNGIKKLPRDACKNAPNETLQNYLALNCAKLAKYTRTRGIRRARSRGKEEETSLSRRERHWPFRCSPRALRPRGLCKLRRFLFPLRRHSSPEETNCGSHLSARELEDRFLSACQREFSPVTRAGPLRKIPSYARETLVNTK